MLWAVLNVAIRVHVAYFLWEVMAHPDDPRFAGKAIPIRNLVIVGGMSFGTLLTLFVVPGVIMAIAFALAPVIASVDTYLRYAEAIGLTTLAAAPRSEQLAQQPAGLLPPGLPGPFDATGAEEKYIPYPRRTTQASVTRYARPKRGPNAFVNAFTGARRESVAKTMAPLIPISGLTTDGSTHDLWLCAFTVGSMRS